MISIGFLIGLTTSNTTIICMRAISVINLDEQYGLGLKLIHKNHFASAIKKDNADKFIGHFNHAYSTSPEPTTPEDFADLCEATALQKPKIDKQLNNLAQLTQSRHANLLKRQAALKQNKFFTIDPKNMRKSGKDAVWGIALSAAGSAVVASSMLYSDDLLNSEVAFSGLLVGLLASTAGLFKLLYDMPRHLWKGLASPKKLKEKRSRNKAIMDAIKEKKDTFNTLCTANMFRSSESFQKWSAR